MTVPTTDNKQFASGNGVTTIFYFAYRLLLASDIQVYVNNTIVGTGNYTVAINSNGIGGSVTFNTAPSGGSNNVLIYRFVDYLQETHFPNESDFNQISLEDAVDKLTMECQQLQEEVGRCIIAPLTDPNIPLLSLPAPEANTAIGWDPTGTFLVDLPLTGILGPQGPSGPSGPAGINAALIPIETQTVSEVNFVNFVTGINSTYSEYQLHYYGVISTVDGSTGRFQITQNGGISWVINSYRWTLASLSSGGQVINSNNNDSSMEWAATLSNDTFKGSSGYINFWNPSATNTRKLFDTKCLAGAPTNAATYTGFSELDTGPGSAMNGIRLFSSTGTISGTFTLYGVTTTGSLAVPGPTGPTGPTGPSGGDSAVIGYGRTTSSAGGVATGSVGITSIVNDSSGVYTVTLSSTPTNFFVNVSPKAAPSNSVISWESLSPTSFKVYVINCTTQSAQNDNFSVIITGV